MPDNQLAVFTPAKTKRASEAIYDQIYQKIVRGELKQGDRLPSERELAEQFHRGRQSVREALRMLQQDGLLQISLGNNGGAFIQGLSLNNAKEPLHKLIDTGVISYKELSDYRYYSDMSCIELALQYYTEEDIEDLEQILLRFKEAIGDRRQFPLLDMEFHSALAKASHNQLCMIVSETVGGLCAKAFWTQTEELSDEEVYRIHETAYAFHFSLLQALIARDAATLSTYVKKMQAIISSGNLDSLSG